MAIQKSIREGFGLVVSEALWKGTPMVAGRAGGIPLQMADEVGGILVDSVEACAHALVVLLQDESRREALGASGRGRVREHFLLPRLLLDELTLMRALVEKPATVPGEDRDPVCGMSVSTVKAAPEATVGGRTYRFCSEACREQFVRDPERFIPAPASTGRSAGQRRNGSSTR